MLETTATKYKNKRFSNWILLQQRIAANLCQNSYSCIPIILKLCESFGAWYQLQNKCSFVLYVSFSCGGICVGLSAILHSYDLLCFFTTLCQLFQRRFFAFFNIEFAKGALAKLQLLACILKPSACSLHQLLLKPASL